MKHFNKHILYTMMGCSMISGLYSCSESINDTLPSIGLTNKEISFNATTSSDVNNNSKTRAAMMSTDGFENPHTLQGFSKTLYLHPLVETLQTQEHAVKTRGALIDAASNMSSFGVTGIYYNNAGELPTLAPNYFHNIETVKSSDNIWTMREKRAWPTSKYKMAIYAYHPFGAPEIAISDESQIGSPSVSYTVGNNPTTMSDFMTASATELNVSTATNNTVPLVFNHNLTAINFVVGKDMIPGTIKSVTFRNIYNEGKFTLGGAWSFTNYSLSDKSYGNLGVAITGAENEVIINGTRTLMMIPQTFSAENQTLEIVFNDGQTDYTLTTTLNGSSWVAGKTVTYKISSSAVTTLNLGTISFATGWDQIGKTTWADGDAVGLYVKDQNGNLKSSNVKLTYSGTDKKWTSATKVLYSPQYDYYVYYPYQDAGVSNTSNSGSAKTRASITAGTAEGFFASGISAWSPKTDQSTSTNINASDLQTAKGLISTVDASSINFTMAHAMGLAKITLGTKTVPMTRTFDGNTNTVKQDVGTKNVTAAANFNGGVIPYYNGNYCAIIKPNTATIFKSAAGVANGWVNNAISLTAASGATTSGTAYSDSTFIYLARAYSYTGSVQQYIAPKSRHI
ncbi:fimbrillin family protein [Prevotella sp.]|uniref:fimbrillin family protein n=1 Tax=Prevotella sp. TaxID=59823 RepID=UPI003DA4CE91